MPSKNEALRKFKLDMLRQFFKAICQSIFERDVLLFAFLLAYKELESELKCDMRQVEFFIKGPLA